MMNDADAVDICYKLMYTHTYVFVNDMCKCPYLAVKPYLVI